MPTIQCERKHADSANLIVGVRVHEKTSTWKATMTSLHHTVKIKSSTLCW
jgi:hypothetical protein